jgi:hypothetical protein
VAVGRTEMEGRGIVIWAAKTFTDGDWMPVQDLFEQQFLALNAPRDMMLVVVDNDDGSQTLYAGLPNDTFLHTFEEFSLVDEAELPGEARLLVGNQTAFEEQFLYSGRSP